MAENMGGEFYKQRLYFLNALTIEISRRMDWFSIQRFDNLVFHKVKNDGFQL